MAQNRSPEFKVVIDQIVCVVEIQSVSIHSTTSVAISFSGVILVEGHPMNTSENLF